MAGGAAAALVLAGASAAIADDIYNNLDNTIDSTAEVMLLTVGGASSTTTIAVNATKDAGENNPCNFGPQGQPTGELKVEVASSDPTIASVSRSTVTFISCNDKTTLTVTPLKAGSTTISLKLVSNTTKGPFDLAPATFRVDVVAPAPTNTAPIVTISGVANGSTYTYGDVLPAMCEVSDAEDGNSSFPATLNGGTDGIGDITASCSHEDRGGLTGSASATYTVVKATPTVTVTCSPDSVVYTAKANDICSATVKGVDLSGSVPVTYDDNINAGTVTATAAFAGDSHHEAVTGYGSFEVTAAPSTVTVTCPESAWLVKDSVEPCSASVTSEGVNMSLDVKYEGHTSFGVASATATYAGDRNHQPATKTVTFQVNQIIRSGFYKPVDMGDKVVNTVKGGSTVPLKFELFLNGVEQTSTLAIKTFTTSPIACTVDDTVTEEEVEITSTGGTSLRYDSTGGQFIQNWQTPKKPNTCYRVTMTTQDGVGMTATFKLK